MLDRKLARKYLKSGGLKKLFNEMGWDNPGSTQPDVLKIDEREFSLLPIAEKRGVMVYQCDTIPNAAMRKKIEREIRERAYEHLIVFTLPDNSKQVWQWVARRTGETDKFREHTWQTNKSPEPLMRKLDRLTVSLDEEEGLTLSETTQRLKTAFDQEKVTKRFYESFRKEHEKFLNFVEGLAKKADREWYASLMLNRLMFVYFIQKGGFLDENPNYLRNRFDRVRETQGRDKFHSFYRAFLLRLFHGGLATPVDKRDEETIQLIGSIPYLNGGLFEPHVFEGEDNKIQIPDEAFESVFAFFDKYEWTLDTRPIESADGRQINPDVLGHIFEKYINQKEMGAYYTKEDITGYITQNTIIPWLFRRVGSDNNVAFAPDGFVWALLRENADRYIYKEVAHGTKSKLPEHIAAGIKDVSKREKWKEKADDELGLPTEIWRETVARRQRHSDVRQKMASGSIAKIEDLITYNLNISRFAQDVILEAESTDLIRAFWDGIRSIKVLDPACGSGAFLFAALNVLHDLYEACLERIEEFVEAAPETKNIGDQNFSYFEKILERVNHHPNRSYFIYKEIILYNLYGVDIMNEAVEICKLRLFLKLASELKQDQEIEALPDIDFNIRAGNSLIGYISADDVKNAMRGEQMDLNYIERVKAIESAAQNLDEAFNSFRQRQIEPGGITDVKSKTKLHDKLQEIDDKLDCLLARDYGVEFDDKEANSKNLQTWRTSVQPFNWLTRFYGILSEGGFDVIIGNPPYLKAGAVDYIPKGFKTKGTIHGYFIEQSGRLLSKEGGMSMIVPMSLTSTQRMKMVQDMIETGRSAWYSNFSKRPAKLFDGVELAALSIFISGSSSQKRVFTTGYKKWTSNARETLMPTLNYVEIPKLRESFWIPKFQDPIELSIFNKVKNQELSIAEIQGTGPKCVYYRTAGGGNWRVFTNFAPKFHSENKGGRSSTETIMSLKKEYNPIIMVALLSSNIFWWWYVIGSDCWSLPKSYIQRFRTNPDIFNNDELLKLGKEYLLDIKSKSRFSTMRLATGTIKAQVFSIHKSKSIIDKIDEVLSRYYGFTAEELDFIKSYDIKFRMGISEANED